MAIANNPILTGSNITFNSTVDGSNNLTVNAGTGNITFGGAVGGSNSLGNLTANTSGTIAFNNNVTAANLTTDAGGTTQLRSNVNTSGNQTYSDAVSIANNPTLTGSNITFNSTVDGSSNLTVNSESGNITFGGAVGGSTPLGNLTANTSGTTAFNNAVRAATLTTNSGGTTQLNANVNTTGNQNYGDAVTVANNPILAGKGIAFDDTVNGSSNLTVNAGTDGIAFNGAIGNISRLGNLTANSQGNLASGTIATASINFTATGSIATGNLDTSSTAGNGGSVRLGGQTIATGDIDTSGSSGGIVDASAKGNLAIGRIDSRGTANSGGSVTLRGANNLQVVSIDTSGGTTGSGGSVDVTAGNFFQATGVFTNQNGVNASISTQGGAITIRHGGSTTTPFVIGDAGINGTAGAISSDANNAIAPTFAVPVPPSTYTVGNINIITSAPSPAPTPTPQPETPQQPIAPTPTPAGAGTGAVPLQTLPPIAPTPTPDTVNLPPIAPTPTPNINVNQPPIAPTPTPDTNVNLPPIAPTPTPNINVNLPPIAPISTPETTVNLPSIAPTPTPNPNVNLLPIAPTPTPQPDTTQQNFAARVETVQTLPSNAGSETARSGNTPEIVNSATGRDIPQNVVVEANNANSDAAGDRQALITNDLMRAVSEITNTQPTLTIENNSTAAASNSTEPSSRAIDISGSGLPIARIETTNIFRNDLAALTDPNAKITLSTNLKLNDNNLSDVIKNSHTNNTSNPSLSISQYSDSLVALARADAGSSLDNGDVDIAVDRIEWLAEKVFSDYFGFDVSRLSPKSVESSQETLRSIEEKTGNRSAIIYTLARQDQLDLILITGTGKAVHRAVRETNRQELMKAAAELRSEITNPRKLRTTSYLPSAKKLYQWSIAPLETELKNQQINTLMFNLDYGLKTVPLSALHDGKQFLIEKYSISTIPSVSLTDTRYQSLERRYSRIILIGLIAISATIAN